MGCNCKTTKKIIDIHKHYGVERNAPWKERFNFHIGNILMFMGIFILLVLFSPLIIVLFIILLIIGKGNLNINKLINFILRKDSDE